MATADDGAAVQLAASTTRAPGDGEPVEPRAEEFFVCATGICVYINVDGYPCRVEFDSPDSPGVATGSRGPGTDSALKAAGTALRRHLLRLAPLFARLPDKSKFRA